MGRQRARQRKAGMKKRVRKWAWCASVFLIIALIAWGLFWVRDEWQFRRAGKRLAAIEAERAIPDAENAAIIYDELLASHDPDSFSVGFLDFQADNSTAKEPWASEDYPELAKWLKGHEGTLLKLLEASRKEKCRLPISINPQEMADMTERLSAARQWAFLLARAANNDLGEGRIEAGLEKHVCLTQMAKHIYQQPLIIDFLVGAAMEGLALNRMACFMVEGDAREVHLDMIETALASTKDNWSEDSSIVLEVERLVEKRRAKLGPPAETHLNLIERLRLWWRNFRDRDPSETMHRAYFLVLRARRASRILVALRRHKNKTGEWPQSLDAIRPSLSEEILVDPFNDGSFVYLLTGNDFRLYSKGENDIDEDGKYGAGADDYSFWPPRSSRTQKRNEDARE